MLNSQTAVNYLLPPTLTSTSRHIPHKLHLRHNAIYTNSSTPSQVHASENISIIIIDPTPNLTSLTSAQPSLHHQSTPVKAAILSISQQNQGILLEPFVIAATMLPVPKDESQTQPTHSRQTVKGVRISCSGDMEILGANKFIPLEVSASDTVWTSDKSTLSEMVGVPVRARKFPPDPAWKDLREGDWYENQAAIRLFRAMNPEQEDFSFVPVQWDLRMGSALVVRDDGKDITPQQVEALCYYGWEHTTEMFEDAMEHEDLTGSKEEAVKLMALFTPEKFGEFFAEFKAKKMEKDASWLGAVSPV